MLPWKLPFIFLLAYIMRRFEDRQPSAVPTRVQKPETIQRDLRYVLTQKCNYDCTFCHKEWCNWLEKDLLNAEDYEFIFATAKKALDIHQVSLSGWEPMMRSDIWNIWSQLKNHGAKITMVSNGALISTNPEALQNIDVLNISLHTTDQQLFTALTRSSVQVNDIINEVSVIQKQYPHLHIKLNSAIIKDQNMPGSKDFFDKIALAETYWRKLKYLELSDSTIPGFVSLWDFEQALLVYGFVKVADNPRQNIYKKGTVEIITWRVFCAQAKETIDPQWYCKMYNDIYVTPDGYLSACPLDIKKFSAYDAIVSRNTELLSSLLQQSIDNKTHYECPFIS